MLSSREAILVVDFIGSILARIINKSSSAAKGLLLLAMEAREEQTGRNSVSLLDLMDIINTTLKNRLESLKVPDYEKAIEKLLAEVKKNQYMILMMII